VADHPTIDDLADAAEGLLDPERGARVGAHVAGCAHCRQSAARLQRVSEVLGVEPSPRMPEAVADRLQAALRQQSQQRASAAHGHRQGTPTPPPTRASAAAVRTLTPHRHRSLGQFGHDLHPPTSWRRVVPLLVAAVLAMVVGFGGYVLSATAGLNEPPVVMTAVSSTDLADQARSIQQGQDLDPHRFSNAWFCARSATRGRITGLAAARVDGSPALLVYTRSGAASVTVVTGCNNPQPTAIASAVLPR